MPVIVTGQQVGPLLTDSDAALMRAWVPKAVCLGCRDAMSLNMSRALGVAEDRLILTGDDALDLIPDKVDCPFPGWIQSRPMVGLSLHAEGSAAARESILSRLVSVLGSWLKTIDANILFLPHVRSDVSHRCDIALARDLIRLLGLDGRAGIVDRQDWYDSHIKHLTSQCQFVVTTRFHGAVFALSSGVPVLALTQDAYTREKFTGLFDYFGLPGPVGDLSDPSVSELVQSSWKARDAWAVEVGFARTRAMERFDSAREQVAGKWKAATSMVPLSPA